MVLPSDSIFFSATLARTESNKRGGLTICETCHANMFVFFVKIAQIFLYLLQAVSQTRNAIVILLFNLSLSRCEL